MRTPKHTEFERQVGHPCPLCQGRMFRETPDACGYRSVLCMNCGAYRIAEDLWKCLLSSSAPDVQELAQYAGCHTRQSYERDGEPVSLNEQNWKELARCRANSGLEEQIGLLMDLLRKLVGRPGRVAKFNSLDSSYGFMVDRPCDASFSELIGTAIDRGYFSLDSEWRFSLKSDIFYKVVSAGSPDQRVASDQGVVTSEASAQKLQRKQVRKERNLQLRNDYKRLRKEKGYNQEWLAHEIGANPSAISRLMNGGNLGDDNYEKARKSVDSELANS